jgi:hypothetical protein
LYFCAQTKTAGAANVTNRSVVAYIYATALDNDAVRKMDKADSKEVSASKTGVP